MNAAAKVRMDRARRFVGVAVALVLATAVQTELYAGFTLQVVDPTGAPIAGGYRWLVEEDNTITHVPGVLVSDSVSVNIHKSYAPVLMSGTDADLTPLAALPATGKYFVSVLPNSGYTTGGASVLPGDTTASVLVNPQPLPTAQISIFIFEDNFPLNNAPEFLNEQGLQGFSVQLFDRFGQFLQDAFGNPLDTTYEFDPLTGQPLLDVDGQPIVAVLGSGVPTSDPTGRVLIKYLPASKFGIKIIPPQGQGWVQTVTIEGTPIIDAWVKANEPPVFVEFGPAAFHAFFGFIRPFDSLGLIGAPGAPTGSITGRVVINHFAAPPIVQGFFSGDPVGNAYVGLNLGAAGGAAAVYAQPAANNPSPGQFTINGVPAGSYQLVTWDQNLDTIFGFHVVTLPDVNGNMNVDLGDVLVFRWFGELEGSVFFDSNQNGFRDAGEPGIPGQVLNLRFRDGTIYQGTQTDLVGNYAFSEVFPFFKWLVAEVDFARFKDTGYTNVVDQGGFVPPDAGWAMPSRNKLTPQPQTAFNPLTGNNLSRTVSGGAPGDNLLQAMQLYLTQVNTIDWGKMTYGPTESGGITGIVHYAVTRAENDPTKAVGEVWEPGIPRVQVNLYQDATGDQIIDDLDGDGLETLADVDNYPIGWINDPFNFNLKGPEDIDRNGDGLFNYGDAIQIVHTDSWDDSLPTACIQTLPQPHPPQVVPECYDNFGTWNQLRPGVFDGGFAIESYFAGGMANNLTIETPGVPPGFYVVEAATPAGYEIVKEEDKNVDFGDEYVPSQRALPPPCIGDGHIVPAELTLFPGIAAPFAGDLRPLCDRKWVSHSNGQNTALNFFLFTPVPKAARAVGFINNDLAAEFDTTSPVFGEKQGARWVPVSFQDFRGNEIQRVYSDEWGGYNALLPANFSINIGAPSGVASNMLSFIINDPGPVPDPNNPGQFVTDPFFDPQFSQTSFTFNFDSGKTTYLDTPVIPVAAFAGFPNGPLDIEPVEFTPMIFSVMGPTGGPVVCIDPANPLQQITISSLGMAEIPNPDYDPTIPGSPLTITRDFGFGAFAPNGASLITVGGVPLNILSWTTSQIVAEVDTTLVSTGQLIIFRADSNTPTPTAVTLHVVDCVNTNIVHVTGGGTWPVTKIQDAIDAAPAGSLIIVEPGTYRENPIIYRNDIQLQGSGAGSTWINGTPVPPDRIDDWHARINALIAAGEIIPFDQDLITQFFEAMEAPDISIFGKPPPFPVSTTSLVDGFTLFGGISGGGVYITGSTNNQTISNNKIFNNQGTFSGGVTVGVVDQTIANNGVNIKHNVISLNGGVNGGGGITIFRGANNYSITDNTIIGNFTRWDGGGISHVGVNDGGLIARNTIAFNEVFYGGLIGGSGGGISIRATGIAFFGAGGGNVPLPPPAPGGATTGTGSVTIDANRIQGNLAGSGSGGGIRALDINGQDVINNPGNPAAWFGLNIFNNSIINNVAAFRAGGISLLNAAKVNIIHNTIANNDSSGTSALAFPPGPLNLSTPQGAGVVSAPHSPALAAASGQAFSDPALINNIIWHNRSFFWDTAAVPPPGQPNSHLLPSPTPFVDVEVAGAVANLNPQNCILTDATGFDPSNTSVDPLFLAEYQNGLLTAAVIDEAGNAITVRYLELALHAADPHIMCCSPARDVGMSPVPGAFAELLTDMDGQPRPMGFAGLHDIGSDEVNPLFDLNGDCVAGPGDFAFIVPCWLKCDTDPAWTTFNCADADFDCSGCVGPGDLAFFINAWLKPCDDPTLILPVCQLPRGAGANGGAGQQLPPASPAMVEAFGLPYPPDGDVRFHRLGDIDQSGQVNLNDMTVFVDVLLGNDVDPAHQVASDLNGDGTYNGQDIQTFIDTVLLVP